MNLQLFPRLRSVWFGATLPFKAMRLIASRPKLIFWSALPIMITLFVYWYALRSASAHAQRWIVEVLMNWGWNPEGLAAGMVLLFSKIMLLILSAITFSFVATITASPFNDFLAESAEPYATPALPSVPETSLGGKLRLIGVDLVKTVASTLASLFAILFSWVPVLNLVAFAVAFLLVTFQYTSYPQTRRSIGLKQGLSFLWSHFYACAGFGAVISLLFTIPVISSFALPLAVVGGTLLVARAPGNEQLKLKMLK